MTKVLAIDQSLLSSGWAVLTEHELIDRGKIKSGYKEDFRNIQKQLEALVDVYEAHKPDVVILEQTTYQRNADTFRKLSKLLGVLELFFYQQGVPTVIYYPSTWRSKVKIKGKKRAEQKLEAKKRVREDYQINASEDESEAILLGLAYLETNQ